LIYGIGSGRDEPCCAGVVGKDCERPPLVFCNATDDFAPIATTVEGSASLFEGVDRPRGILRNGKHGGHPDGLGRGATSACVNKEPNKLCDRLREIRVWACFQTGSRLALDVNCASVRETQHNVVESVAGFELKRDGMRIDNQT